MTQAKRTKKSLLALSLTAFAVLFMESAFYPSFVQSMETSFIVFIALCIVGIYVSAVTCIKTVVR